MSSATRILGLEIGDFSEGMLWCDDRTGDLTFEADFTEFKEGRHFSPSEMRKIAKFLKTCASRIDKKYARQKK